MKKPKKQLILTIDLEWYYPGDATGVIKNFDTLSFKQRLKYDNSRIEKSLDIILNTLQKYNQKITFFVVAELDRAYPQLLKQIIKDGHEIALHSFSHQEYPNPSDFENDLIKCIPFQRKYKVIGYRSPRIKITKKHYPILKKLNYKYDSSIYGTAPFSFNGVKILPVSVFPYWKENIKDIPSHLSLRLISQAIPFGGGMFIALLQKNARFFIERYNAIHKHPPCVFLHSWQIINNCFPLKSMIKNPYILPYSIGCKDLLEWTCKTYKLVRVKDYLR